MGREWILIGPQSFRLAAVTLTATSRGDCHCGWYCGKHGEQRPHAHTHLNVRTDTLSPSLCPLQSGDRPSSHAPVFPRGGQTCCAIRSSSRLFSPPPPSALISSYLMHSSSPPLLSCSTATPPGLGILKLFCWFHACDLPQKVLPLSSDNAINPFLSPFLLFSLTIQTWCSLSCQKFCIGMKQGVLCQSEVISMAILLLVSLFGLEYSVRSHLILFFLFMSSFKTQRHTSFISSTASLLSMKIQSHPGFLSQAPNQMGNWNKCNFFFSLYYDFSPSVHRLTVSQYESLKMATAFVKPEGISASHLDSN